MVLSALLLSTVAGRDCANLLSSGSSRLPSNGQALVVNTPMLKNKWKNRSEVHHSYKAQVGLPTSNAGDPTITVNLSD